MSDCTQDKEPPYAEPHVRWCERSENESRKKTTSFSSYSIYVFSNAYFPKLTLCVIVPSVSKIFMEMPLSSILEEAPALYVRSTASAALLRGASVSSVQADRSDAPINIGMDKIHDFVSFISSSD